MTHTLDRDASHAAWLGAEIRSRRQARGLTLKALASLIGFSSQHLSEVELARCPVSEPFVAACDQALEARGRLLELLPAVVWERAMERHKRSTARRWEEGRDAPAINAEIDTALAAPMRAPGSPAALRWTAHPSEAEEDVDPLNRRSLLGTGIGAALGLGATTAPAVAREIDPDLVSHWIRLLRVLSRHDAMFGPHEVLGAVRREIALISEHRRIADGELRTQLIGVESIWAWFASWLSNDAGDWRSRDSWAERSLLLAQEARDPEMVAWALMWQGRWAASRHDARRAVALADKAGRTPGATPKLHGLAALKEAHGHALTDDLTACQARLDAAHGLLERAPQSDQPALWEDIGRRDGSSRFFLLAEEARSWLLLQPSKAIAMLEEALRIWPQDRARGRGIHQARLALACATANEPDRAVVEGIKALDIAKATKSDVTVRELRRLDHQLAACDLPAAADFREAFATL